MLGYKFGDSKKLIEHYDYLAVANNEDGIDGLYFDVSHFLNSLSKIFSKQWAFCLDGEANANITLTLST